MSGEGFQDITYVWQAKKEGEGKKKKERGEGKRYFQRCWGRFSTILCLENLPQHLEKLGEGKKKDTQGR